MAQSDTVEFSLLEWNFKCRIKWNSCEIESTYLNVNSYYLNEES